MKKLLLLLTLFATVAMAQVPTAGLVAYYPFNNNANDNSGNNLNGVVTTATLINDRFANASSAYHFDGTNDYIDVADNSLLNFSVNNTITISVWLRAQNLTPSYEYVFLSKQSGMGTTQQGFNCAVNSTDLTFIVRDGNGTPQNNNSTPSTSVLDNNWHNVVYVFNKDTSDIYVDGVFKNRNIVANAVLGSNSQSLLIGKANWVYSNTKQFAGDLDDIRIYNKALKPTEIKAIANEGLCYQTVTVTDTLLINMGITGFNPITYSNTIKIFPNPSNSQITIDCGNYTSLSGYKIKITNTLSQVVYQTNITQSAYTVALSTFGGMGLYFVNVYDGQNNLIDVRKIVLQ